MDIGPEFISTLLAGWAEEHNIHLDLIEPDLFTQNSFLERYNRTYRDGILNKHVFKTLNEIREVTENWMKYYHDEKPHDSINM